MTKTAQLAVSQRAGRNDRPAPSYRKLRPRRADRIRKARRSSVNRSGGEHEQSTQEFEQEFFRSMLPTSLLISALRRPVK